MPGKICLGDIIYLIYLFLLSLYIGITNLSVLSVMGCGGIQLPDYL